MTEFYTELINAFNVFLLVFKYKALLAVTISLPLCWKLYKYVIKFLRSEATGITLIFIILGATPLLLFSIWLNPISSMLVLIAGGMLHWNQISIAWQGRKDRKLAKLKKVKVKRRRKKRPENKQTFKR